MFVYKIIASRCIVYLPYQFIIRSKTRIREKQIIYDNQIFVQNQAIVGMIANRYAEAKKKSDKVNLKLIINRAECEYHLSTGTIKK